MKSINLLLMDALKLLFSYLYEFAFEHTESSSSIVKEVTFNLVRPNCLKVACSGESGLFYGVEIEPMKIEMYLCVLKRYNFIVSYRRMSPNSFGVVLRKNPSSMAA